MTTTLAALRVKVREGLRDTVQPYHVETDELDGAIRNAVVTASAQIPLGEKWVAGAVTLTAGSDTATLPSGVEYAQVYALRRTSDGQMLDKLTVDEAERKYWWDLRAADATAAEPAAYCMTEDEDGLVTLRFDAPVLSEATLDLRRAVLPSDLTEDTDTAPLSSLMVMAVSDLAVSELIGKLNKNELDQLRLDRDSARRCDQRAAGMIRAEKERRAGLEAVGRVQRNVP